MLPAYRLHRLHRQLLDQERELVMLGRQIAARRVLLAQVEARADRRRRARQMIVLGASLVARARYDPAIQQLLTSLIDDLSRPHDRTLFQDRNDGNKGE